MTRSPGFLANGICSWGTLFLAFLACCPAAARAQAAGIPESPVQLGYSSVTAALQGLQARSDVIVSHERGWTIVADHAKHEVWSFAPPEHPAYPAVARRSIVPRNGGFAIDAAFLCEASKAACDGFVRAFTVQQAVGREDAGKAGPLGRRYQPPSAAPPP